jgi:hypothetical protein
MRHFFILVACIFLLCGCENIVNAFSTSLGTQLTRKYDFSSYSLKDLSDKLSTEYTTLEQKKDILAEMDKKNGAEVSKLSKDEKNNIISAVAEVTCSTEIIAAIAEEINFDALGETNVSSILAALPDAESFAGINAIANILDTDKSYVKEGNITSLSLAAGVMTLHTLSWLNQNRSAFNDDSAFFTKIRNSIEDGNSDSVFEAAGLLDPEPGSVDAQVKKNLEITLEVLQEMKNFDAFGDSLLGKLLKG